MPTQDQMDHLFREVGLTVHLSQVLDVSVRALIGVSLRDTFDETEKVLTISDSRATLGYAIRAITELGVLDGVGLTALRVALEARNYVAHEMFIRHTHAFTDDHAYDEALSALMAKQKDIAIATGLMSGLAQGVARATRTRIRVRQDTPPS